MMMRGKLYDPCSCEMAGEYRYYAGNLYFVRWLSIERFMTRDELIQWARRLDYLLDEVEETLG